MCLPHVRGGVSLSPTISQTSVRSSPRAWGCFSRHGLAGDVLCVFPTCVGVFPFSSRRTAWTSRLPHVRGGVSSITGCAVRLYPSSPRAWGCFYHVPRTETLPIGLPHVRGGVSSTGATAAPFRGSSPRAWGCFSRRTSAARHPAVFPTCVGVFPWPQHETFASKCLPHVRGGVSMVFVRDGVDVLSSPRAWGCFRPLELHRQASRVFPTCVGVFLPPATAQLESESLPHVRGGVSDPTARDSG